MGLRHPQFSIALSGVFVCLVQISSAAEIDPGVQLDWSQAHREHLAEDQRANRERISGLPELLRQRQLWKQEQEAARRELQGRKRYSESRGEESTSEQSSAYQQDLRMRKIEEAQRVQAQKEFALKKRRDPEIQRNISPEVELGLKLDRERVDWNRRKFFTGPGAGRGTGGGSNFDSGFSNPPPPSVAPPPPPPPEFFDAGETQQPPPMSPQFNEGENSFNENMIPPPPPPLFDEEPSF